MDAERERQARHQAGLIESYREQGNTGDEAELWRLLDEEEARVVREILAEDRIGDCHAPFEKQQDNAGQDGTRGVL